MYHIKYTVEDAQKDMNDYNNSLDKSLKTAEQRIQEAARRGCCGCALQEFLEEVDHWLDVKKELIKAGYKVDVLENRWFNVFW